MILRADGANKQTRARAEKQQGNNEYIHLDVCYSLLITITSTSAFTVKCPPSMKLNIVISAQ